MLARNRAEGFALVCLAALAICAVSACEKVPLMAPVGSSITLTASASALSANDSTRHQRAGRRGSRHAAAQRDTYHLYHDARANGPHRGRNRQQRPRLGEVHCRRLERHRDDQRGFRRRHDRHQRRDQDCDWQCGGRRRQRDGESHVPCRRPAAARRSPRSCSTSTATRSPGPRSPLRPTAGTLSATVVPTDNAGSASTVLTTNQTATVTASVGATTTTTTPPGTGDRHHADHDDGGPSPTVSP